MNNRQKSKRNFRASKKWKDFRHSKFVEQHGLDPITKTKLIKTSTLHHKCLNLDEETYQDVSNPDDFIFLTKECHKVVHWCLNLVKKYNNMSVLDRLYDEIKDEAVRNGFLGE